MKYSSRFAADLNDEEALALFTIKLNSAENGGDPANGVVLSHDDINISHQWDWPNENTIAFTMPNVYNGNPDWLHSFEITGVRGGIHNSVTRIVLKPTHMIGGYAQFSYGFNYYGTIGTNRDEFVVVRKMAKVDWLDTPADDHLAAAYQGQGENP